MLAICSGSAAEGIAGTLLEKVRDREGERLLASDRQTGRVAIKSNYQPDGEGRRRGLPGLGRETHRGAFLLRDRRTGGVRRRMLGCLFGTTAKVGSAVARWQGQHTERPAATLA